MHQDDKKLDSSDQGLSESVRKIQKYCFLRDRDLDSKIPKLSSKTSAAPWIASLGTASGSAVRLPYDGLILPHKSLS
jgi:hypothetical protein